MEAIKWNSDSITVLNAQLLPDKSYYHNYKNFREIGAAVEAKIIPGTVSRAIAVVMSASLTAEQSVNLKADQFKEHLSFVVDYFEKITLANPLTGGILSKLRNEVAGSSNNTETVKKFKEMSVSFFSDLHDRCAAVAENVQHTMVSGESILLFSAAGSSLAAPAGGFITSALIAAKKNDKQISSCCCETRPDFSGSRIMAFDLKNEGLETQVIPDIQSHYVMKKKLISRVVVVADSIFEKGVFRAHCGCAMLVLAARSLGVPVDLVIPGFLFDKRDYAEVEIEANRASINEVAIVNNGVVAPEGIVIGNYLSDTVDCSDISRFITDKGVFDNWQNTLASLKSS